MELEIKTQNGLDIVRGNPTTITDTEYEIIEMMFAAGNTRAYVIEKLKWDQVYYYSRLKRDARLSAAERDGQDLWIKSMSNEVAAALSMAALGHKVKVKKEFYTIEKDEKGEEIQVLKGLQVEEKYIPPNAAVIGMIAKKVVPSLGSGTSEDQYDDYMEDLSDEDINKLAEIGNKILNR